MEITEKKSNKRLNAVSVPAEAAMHVVTFAFAFACILPFLFVVVISFSSKESILRNGYSFVPDEWSVSAYKYAFDLGRQLWISYANSFLITIVGTVISVAICVLYSYGLFRKDYPFRRFFSFFSFFTMMFGGGLVPTIMVCKTLGLNNNYAALIVPLLVSPFNFIVMRTFFSSQIPDSLIEAAGIDGSGEYRTLVSIVLPIAKPGIATIALLNALAFWNEWYLTLLYAANSPNLYPLQYLLIQLQRNMEFLVQNASKLGAEASNIARNMPSQSLRMALCVFIVVPIACAYPFFQRYIISGLTIGAVKE